MKKLLIFLLLVLAMGASAQEIHTPSPADKIAKWKQAVVASGKDSRMPEGRGATPLSEKDLAKFDFRKFWLSHYALGYTGHHYQRMTMTFERVNKLSATEYAVSGFSRVNHHVCDFKGIFRIFEQGQYQEFSRGVDDAFVGKVKSQGYVLAEFLLEEDATQKGSGVFRGVLRTGWYVNMKDEFLLDGIDSYSDRWSNNQFYGEWTSHKGGAPKPVAWGHFRIPMSGDLDMGAGEFSPADQYLDHGWREYRLVDRWMSDQLNKRYGR
ncbi:hypothetical protein AGMMS50289_00800 [Betaproteobacteria bacterium]|nr:hypothetical protein AGMMS50289_00800 [Betaproteobacteria bacterium]